MQIIRHFLTLAALAATLFVGYTNRADALVSDRLAGITLKDLTGKTYGPAELAKHPATVFFFSSTQCPISNIYVGRMNNLAKAYSPRGIAFFLVNSNVDDSAESLSKYVKANSLAFPAVKDKGTELADRLEANATPEAIVADASGAIRYRGRIDDNKDRERVVHQNLKEALDAILVGNPVPVTRTLPAGCAIFRSKPATAKTAGAVTYSGQVAKILNENCVVCHRAGEVAPFSLENYRQARTWAQQIKEYTGRRIMPPWKPVTGFGEFHDQRRLTDNQIASLARWAESGAPQGDPKAAPSAPRFPDPAGWTLGKPDKVLSPARDYHLASEGRDVYRNFALPVDFAEDTYLTGMEFKPGNRGIVHHVVAYIDPQRHSDKLDGKDSEPGWTVPGTSPGFEPAIWGEVWVPGSEPRPMPAGVAIAIPKGSRLVIQVHYHKSGKPEVDRTQVALYYAKSQPEKVIHTPFTGQIFFALKPGEKKNEVNCDLVLPFDATLHTIFPHMHMLGKEMKVVAKLPDGTEQKLIYIDDWDFNWQATYRYKQPLKLPKGTRIKIEAVYDNSESNPHQTSHPPRLVTFGEQTTDEMLFCFFGVTLDNESLSAAKNYRQIGSLERGSE